MFFSSWFDILRIFVMATLGYVGLMTVLRITGKRALSKMNAFDFVITVAMGSALSTVILSKDVVLVEGIFAFVMLCTLQYVTTLIFLHMPRMRSLLQAQPTLLMYRGIFYYKQMHGARITEDEILGALREKGVRWEDAQAVILENDGALTVVPTSHGNSQRVYEGVTPSPYDHKPLKKDKASNAGGH